ncbi:MAG: helix-turn-helix domain-containing protein [Tidjanibacter sp.]|nr:helix-turn-helix domain-containing protein [Tidjanibacter sp.]MBR7102330.1 helix-turn-helix domain-containing protein [Tidjanibacter sp.]
MVKKIISAYNPDGSQHSYIYNYVSLSPKEQIAAHKQDMWELSLVLSGRGIRTLGSVEEPFEVGEVVLVPPNVVHCWKFDEECVDERGEISNITILFSQQLIKGCVSLFPELSGVVQKLCEITNPVIFQGELRDNITALLVAMRSLSDADRVGRMLSLLPMLTEERDVRVVGVEIQNEELQRLNRITTFLICSYQRHVTLDEVARYVGMTRSSLCTFFKRMTGQTIFYYLNRFRIDMACDMIRRDNHTVAEVCYACGFGDPPYFHRLFKRIKGCTPTEYRRGGGDD